MDWYAATFSVTIFALLEVLVMTYIYGKNDVTFCINNKNVNIFFLRPEQIHQKEHGHISKPDSSWWRNPEKSILLLHGPSMLADWPILVSAL